MFGDERNRFEEGVQEDIQACRRNLADLKQQMISCTDPEERWELKQRKFLTEDRIRDLQIQIQPN